MKTQLQSFGCGFSSVQLFHCLGNIKKASDLLKPRRGERDLSMQLYWTVDSLWRADPHLRL